MSKARAILHVTIQGRVLTAPMTGVSDLPFRRIEMRFGLNHIQRRL